MKRQIKNIDDIKLLVDDFYEEVRQDAYLADIFNEVIQDKWPEHLDKMYRFWQTVLLDEHSYKGSPFLPHAELPVERKHFNRWLELFQATVEKHFEGEVADEAIWRANKMAEMFQMKIAYYKNSSSSPIQ